MRIAILSAGAGWHVRDLKRAASDLRVDIGAVDFRRLTAGLGGEAKPLAGFDGVLVRTMPPGSLEQVVFRMDLLHRAQAEGIRVLNPPRSVEICVDKYLASALLHEAGLSVPPTIVCQHADAAMEAFAKLGRDVVIKPLFGSEGRGMIRVSDIDLAWRTLQALERVQSVIYVQKYIDHSGWDLRAFVVGSRVVAAMRRRSTQGWRTNVAQGGVAEPAQLSSEQESLALRSAAAVGAAVAGVDLLPGPDGEMYVLEINAVPGWRALAPVTGVDIAKVLLQFFVDEYQEL